MTERGERDEQAMAVRRHLLARETAHILPTDERIGAFVGASTEMIKAMMQTGRLTNPTEEPPQLLRFTPTQQLLPRLSSLRLDRRTLRMIANPDAIREEAVSLGSHPAQLHFFMNEIGLQLDDLDARGAAIQYLMDANPKTLESRRRTYGSDTEGIQQEIKATADLIPHLHPEELYRMGNLTKATWEKKGFLLGINRAAKFDLVFSEGHGELALSYDEKGLPYKTIVAVEALSTHEEQFLTNLKYQR